MDIVQLISAAGIGGIVGSLLTTLVQAWISNKQRIADRNFQEKKEAYLGLLESYTRNEIENSEATQIATGYWKNRIELVGSQDVIKCCAKIIETNPLDGKDHPDRPAAMSWLKKSMRKDLGVE